MTTAFPGAIDDFTNPVGGDPLDSVTVPHASQHANINDAVEAIETAIGTTAAPVLAPLASPTFTGVPAAPTAAVATNTTQIATTEFVLANAGSISYGYTSGYYYKGLGNPSTINPAVLSTTYYYPLVITKTHTFDRIALTTLSSFSGTGAVRLGIYNNDSTTGKPSTVVLDAGTVATTAPSTIYEITISQSLTAGAYWLAFNSQTNAASNIYRGNSATSSSPSLVTVSTTGINTDAGAWSETGITGAFATAGTLTNEFSVPAVSLRAT